MRVVVFPKVKEVCAVPFSHGRKGVRRAVFLWVEKACLASFCRGRKRNAGCRFAAGGRRAACRFAVEAARRAGRLHFGFVALGSPSVIGGYVWELLAKQQLPIRRNRPVDEHISMRRKRRRKLFRCEEYMATCDKAACAPLLCHGGREFGWGIRDVPPHGARSCSLTPFPFLRAQK